MIADGLINELLQFHKDYNEKRMQEGKEFDYSHGIFQSIGFKEFHPYLTASEEFRASPEGETLLAKCIEDMKYATRRYAKRQLSWFKNRLLEAGDREVPPTHQLNADNLENWEEDVWKPTQLIVEHYLNGSPLPPELSPLPIEKKPMNREEERTRNFTCQACDVTVNGRINWDMHIKSKPHRYKMYVELAKQRELAQSQGKEFDPKQERQKLEAQYAMSSRA